MNGNAAAPLVRRLSALMAIALFGVNLYRAAHQSITTDEAYTYALYIGSPITGLFTKYEANHHVLHTFLCRLAVGLFGLSEFTLRMPSLAGGLLYLVAARRLCVSVFSKPWLAVLGMSVLTLNPFILDYLSVARGYGLALGFFFAGLALLCSPDEPAAVNRAQSWGGLCLGLSIASNLSFLVPCVALGAVVTAFGLRSGGTPGAGRRLVQALKRLWTPLLAPLLLLVAVPLSHAHKDNFRYGADSLRETAVSVVQRSFFHQYDVWRGETIPAGARRAWEAMADWALPGVLAITLAAAVFGGLRLIRTMGSDPPPGAADRFLPFAGATIGLSLGALVLAHRLAGVLYPIDRTAIYLVALVSVAFVSVIDRIQLGVPGRIVFIPLLSAVAVVSLIAFARGFTTEYYYEWRFDAGTKRVFALMAQRQQRHSGPPVRVGADWRLVLSLDFYRRMHDAGWMAPFDDRPTEDGGFEYYVFVRENQGIMAQSGLHVIYRDPVSGQALAAGEGR